MSPTPRTSAVEFTRPVEFTRLLSTADDWPVWIAQVEARLASFNSNQYLTINDAGVLELNPPKPPPRPSDDVPDRRTRVPGRHGQMQWPYEEEYLEYTKSKNEYLGFMLAVQRSVDPNIGFDMSKERSFSELVRDLRIHLGIREPHTTTMTVANFRPAEKDDFDTLIEMDLRQGSIEVWGERLVNAYKALCRREPKRRREWRPLINFILAVDVFYPIMSAVLYVRLEKLERKQARRNRDWPRKSSFEGLVNFGVRMISLLAEGRGERVIENYVTAGDDHDSLVGVAAGIVEYGLEPRADWDGGYGSSPQGEAPLVLKRRRDEEPQVEAMAPMPRKRVKFDLPPEDSATARLDALVVVPRVPHAEDEDEEEDGLSVMSGALRAVGPEVYQREPSPEGDDTSSGDDGQSEESHRLDTLERISSVALTFPSSESSTKDSRAMSNTERDGRCRICDSLRHDTAACGLLKLYRHHGEAAKGLSDMVKQICKLFLENEKPSNAGTKGGQGPVAGQRAITSQGTNPKTRTIVNKGGIKGYDIVKQEDDEETEVNEVSAPPTITNGVTSGETRRPADISTRVIPGPQALSPTTSFRPPEPRCHICQKENHSTRDCFVLAFYRSYGSFDKLSRFEPAVLKRCLAEFQSEDANARANIRCYICKLTNHFTASCRWLKFFRMHGNSTRGLHHYRKERCREWLLTLYPPGENNGHTAALFQVPGQSERCDERECLTTITTDRARRDEATQGAQDGAKEPPAPLPNGDLVRVLTSSMGSTGSTSSSSSTSSTSTMASPLPAKPQDVDRVETEDVQCFICEEAGHISDDCQFFRACQKGEKASLNLSHDIRLRCQVLMHAKDPNGKIHVERCYICDLRNHATHDCRFLWLYQKHGDSAVGMGSRNKMRCRAWVLNQKPVERVSRNQCYICHATAHATDECGSLETYRKRGGVSLGQMPGVFVDRCRFWLLEEENPVIMKSTGNGCDICSDRVHATENCKYLERWRADKACSSVSSVYSVRCKAYTQYIWALDSAKDKQDDIKDRPGSVDIECVSGRVVTKFAKDNGTAVVKENETAIAKEKGAAVIKERVAASAVVKKNGAACTKKGRAVIEKKPESAVVKKGSQTTGVAEKKKSGLSPTVCTICNSQVHLEDSCKTLKHFRKHGSVPYIYDGKCRKWMSEETRVGLTGIDDMSSSDAALCRICRGKGHFTMSCLILKDYRIDGDQTRRVTNAIKARWKKWIGEEVTKVRAALMDNGNW